MEETTEDVAKIIDKLRDACLEERGWKPRESYSGRGMYGASCFGIVLPPDDVGVAKRLHPGACSDSMGRDAIVYWPSLKTGG